MKTERIGSIGHQVKVALKQASGGPIGRAPIVPVAIIFVLSAASWGSGAAPEDVAAGMGHDLAEHSCTGCHLIERGQVNPPDHVGGPTFQSIANRGDVTADTLRHHMRTTQSDPIIPLAMPNPELNHDEIVKLVGYILSLRTSVGGSGQPTPGE